MQLTLSSFTCVVSICLVIHLPVGAANELICYAGQVKLVELLSAD